MSLNLKKIKPGWELRLLRWVYYYVQAEFSSIEGAAPLLSSGPSLALLRGPLLITSSHYTLKKTLNRNGCDLR